MRKTIVLTSLLLFLVLIAPLGVQAASFHAESSVYVGKNEIIPDNLYAAGNTITIDGEIKGDLICVGNTVIINGKVDGDVICAGQNINVSGEVTGSARLLGDVINLNNKIGKSINVAGESVNLGSNTQVGQDVIMAAVSSEVRGKINRDLICAGGNVVLAGEVDGKANFWLRKKVDSQADMSIYANPPLSIIENAKINGNLTYTAFHVASIASTTVIKGKITHNIPTDTRSNAKVFAAFLGWLKIIALFSALVIGLVIISLWREETKKITDLMLGKIGVSFGWGVVVLFLTPIIVILLLFTIIGIPLALIMGAFWLIGLAVSKIFAAILIGRMLIEKFWQKRKDSLFLIMIVGVLAFWILCIIPILGPVICFLATLWGLGGLWLFFKKS